MGIFSKNKNVISVEGYANDLLEINNSGESLTPHNNSKRILYFILVLIIMGAAWLGYKYFIEYNATTYNSEDAELVRLSEEKMKKDPELAEKGMGKVESFIQNHPTRPGRVLSYLIALDENGDIAHFRVTGGGGHISGPSEADLRQFEEEQKAKREKKVQQEKENREYSLKVAEERKRLQEEIYHKQSVETVLQEQMLSNTKMSGIISAYEAGTIAGDGLL